MGYPNGKYKYNVLSTRS